MNSPGVVRAKKIEKIGMHSSDTAQLFFENVRVPKKNIIGEEGKGFQYQMIQFQQERIFAIAAGLAPMQRVLNDTIEVKYSFLKDRKNNKKNIFYQKIF